MLAFIINNMLCDIVQLRCEKSIMNQKGAWPFFYEIQTYNTCMIRITVFDENYTYDKGREALCT